MKKLIMGFRQDESGYWIADLECGHAQHVRHNPPWQNRSWVVHAETRQKHVGQPINCRLCKE